jgi:metal-sulfur cluster biosynthetic enzyme
MAITMDEVRSCLEGVADPELGINIVDLGFVYSASAKEHRGYSR